MPRNAGGWVCSRRAALAWWALVPELAGCGGGSGGADTTAASSGAAAAASGSSAAISFAAVPASVPRQGTSTLNWRVAGARTCEASGGWRGTRAAAGAETVGPLLTDTTFRLSCSGAKGGVQRQLTVIVGADGPPTIALAAEPPEVAAKGSVRLVWSVRGATSCRAGGHWSGAQPLTGSFGTGPLSQSQQYQLTCLGPGGTSLASVTVGVLDGILRWQAPTRNADGSPLTDLAGYRIYWGTASGVYERRHTIPRPTTTHWRVTAAPGTYYFALTAFDRDGSESGYSNEVIKTIP